MTKGARFAVFCVICVVLAPTGLAQKHHRRKAPRAMYLPEVFSSLFLEQGTGDVGGMEVILVPSYNGTWATVMLASGVAYDPVLVVVKTDGLNIEFILPENEHYGSETYTGTISKAGLTLSSKGGGREFLRRQVR